MKKLFILFIAVVGFGVSSYGQASATATSTATIITPITLTKVNDMNFGNILVSGTLGTVVLTPASARSLTGGVSLASTGTVTAASFTVGGSGSNTYAITLPTGATTLTSGANTMTCDTWTSIPSSTGVLSSGSQTLNVGATLHVAANQATGTYVSGTAFTVSVDYN